MLWQRFPVVPYMPVRKGALRLNAAERWYAIVVSDPSTTLRMNSTMMSIAENTGIKICNTLYINFISNFLPQTRLLNSPKLTICC